MALTALRSDPEQNVPAAPTTMTPLPSVQLSSWLTLSSSSTIMLPEGRRAKKWTGMSLRKLMVFFFHCEKSYQRRHSCGRGCWWSAQRCLTPVWGDQWSLPGRPAASLWSPSHWSCGCWSCCSISAAALETDYTLPFIKIELMLLKLRWNIHLNNDFNPTRPVSSDERGILIFWWLIPWLISDDLLAVALLLFSFKWQVENYRKMNALRM